MPFVYLSKITFVLSCYLIFQCWAHHISLLAQSSNAADGLNTAEKEAIQKAKDPAEQLKLYLDIATDRLKSVISLSRKGDGENTAKAVTGFQTAVNGAEESLARGQAEGKNMKKSMNALLKATKKYNFSLVQVLEKVPEDLREHIQSAYNVSQRVQDGVALQLQRLDKK